MLFYLNYLSSGFFSHPVFENFTPCGSGFGSMDLISMQIPDPKHLPIWTGASDVITGQNKVNDVANVGITHW
jgi:hypothetical protein